MFVVKCPRCGECSKAFADQAGSKGLCPHCSRKILIVAAVGENPRDEYPAVKVEQQSLGGLHRVRLPDTSPPAGAQAAGDPPVNAGKWPVYTGKQPVKPVNGWYLPVFAGGLRPKSGRPKGGLSF